MSGTLAAYTPFQKQNWSEEPDLVRFDLEQGPVKRNGEVQPESFDWLRAGLNALVNAFRPRVIKVQREMEEVAQG